MNGITKNLAIISILLSIPAAAGAETVPASDPCAGVNAIASSSNKDSGQALVDLINSGSDSSAQSCAIRAAGQTKNVFAAEALLGTVETYQSQKRGPYETDLRARLKAIDAIWALGEIGEPRVMAKLLDMFYSVDDTLRINMVVGAGKTKSRGAQDFLTKVAGNLAESNVVRAAAYEMLEQNKAPMPAPRLSQASGMEKGDLIFTGGIFGVPQNWIGDLPIGHAGLYAGTEIKDGKVVVVIYDCVPDSFKPYGGVRKIFSFYHFTHRNIYAFYGNRVTRPAPTPAQRDLIIKAAVAKVGHHYSDSHLSQQGPEDFDCVGFTEYAYEAAGLNPTPEDQETGWGWPLTPAEQFAATFANARPVLPTMGPIKAAAGPSQSILDNGAAGLLNSFGLKAQERAEVKTDIQPEIVD